MHTSHSLSGFHLVPAREVARWVRRQPRPIRFARGDMMARQLSAVLREVLLDCIAAD